MVECSLCKLHILPAHTRTVKIQQQQQQQKKAKKKGEQTHKQKI